MSDNVSNNKRIAKNSLFLSIRMLIVLGLSLYTTRAILSVLGVVDYGIYNVVAGFVSMFAFLNTSMAATSQRYFNVEYAKNGIEGASLVFNVSLRIHFFLAFVIVILTELFGIWYLHHKMVLPEERMFAAECIFHSSILSMFFAIINVPYLSAIMAHEKMDFYALVTTLDAVLKLVIVLVLPYVSYDQLIVYGLLFVLISVFDFVAYYIYAKKKFQEVVFRPIASKGLFKEMLVFSLWNSFGTFSYVLRNQGITLVLNAYFGPIVNAARGVAGQVDAAIAGFVNNLVIPARPQMTQSYAQGDKERAFRITYSISKLSCLFFFCLSFPLILESNFIFHFWLGDNIPDHAQSFVAIILLTNMFGCLLPPISTLVFAEGRMKYFQLLTSISNLLSIPLALIFLCFDNVPEFVFGALFLTMVTNQIAAMVALKKYIEYSVIEYLKKVVLPILYVATLSIIIATPIHFIMQDSFLRFFLQTVVCIGVTVIATYFIALDSVERYNVGHYLKKIISKIK